MVPTKEKLKQLREVELDNDFSDQVTRQVMEWIKKEPGLQLFWLDRAEEIDNEYEGPAERLELELRSWLKDEVQKTLEGSLLKDILCWRVVNVDYKQLAEKLINDIIAINEEP